jgi:hypothetical protein
MKLSRDRVYAADARGTWVRFIGVQGLSSETHLGMFHVVLTEIALSLQTQGCGSRRAQTE